MKTVVIDGAAIVDEPSLHREFAAKMGFAGFYGHNWDAWIDCMGYITEPEAKMTEVHVASGDELLLKVVDGHALERRCPELVKVLLECGDFANERLQRRGEGTRIRVFLGGAAQQAVAADDPAAGKSE
jgi:RNAse (barnase) inhibitor barstar